VLIDRLYLRNYRVFEDELDLCLPPGLVGVYGPNGAGKSTLLESILWALWGRARTAKEGVPSSGTHGECVVQVTFEHEGHVYLVRRTISGVNATVRAEAHCDGRAMAEGARDTSRYVHSVLGMDDASFRASVFAEQKQIDAFSSQGPADRRKLVLGLLGVTPLDTARDRARADARETSQQHSRLRGMLPDLEAARLRAADKEAAAGAAEAAAAEEERAATTFQEFARASREAFERLDRLRQEHEMLIVEGKAARGELDAAEREANSLQAELGELAGAEARLAQLAEAVSALAAAEQRSQLLAEVEAAGAELSVVPEQAAAPPPPDEDALAQAAEAATSANVRVAAAQAVNDAALAHRERAKLAAAKSEGLSAAGECPLCGQVLGEAFAQVQAHRASELAAADEELAEAARHMASAAKAARLATADLGKLSAAVEAARTAHATHAEACARRASAAHHWRTALATLGEADELLAESLERSGPPGVLRAKREGTDELARCRAARDESARLQGRLERQAGARAAHLAAQERAATARSIVEALRGKLKALGFEPAALAGATEALASATGAAEQADAMARRARLAAAKARTEAEAEARRLADAESQHAKLAELESGTLHLSRTAELLNAFRNSVVASVGPRLAVQAAELFDELTDNEYDRLEVDAETYGLRIVDGGVSYELDRFSGSETDLANLALRVAISEHVRFQSGGSVGLLVLDEVFGPLDEERRARMLVALERLRGRFRQVLVVTHSTEIKEQLPRAIEVVRKPGRRATARVVES